MIVGALKEHATINFPESPEPPKPDNDDDTHRYKPVNEAKEIEERASPTAAVTLPE